MTLIAIYMLNVSRTISIFGSKNIQRMLFLLLGSIIQILNFVNNIKEHKKKYFNYRTQQLKSKKNKK